MPHLLRRRNRLVAGAFAMVLVITSCGGDDDSDTALDLDSWVAAATSSSTTSSSTTSTTTTTTTTTAPPRELTADELVGVLLSPADVPQQASEQDDSTPPLWEATDPPECGEVLSSEGPGDVRVARAFFEPEGFLSYQSVAQHTPGQVEDLEVFREGIAGPCSEGFRHVEGGVESFQRLLPLPDPDVGDDALAARFEMQYEVDGRQVEVWAYMVYFTRGDVVVQVQIVSGAIPAEGLQGPDISIEEVVRLAELIDGRVRSL